jgi:molybdate transport system substrate-binding protein
MRSSNRPTATTLKLQLLSLSLLMVLLTAACSSDDGDSAATTTVAPATKLQGSITISAAASLRDAFTDIADAFSAAHPEVALTTNFDSSSTLATQIIDGAPVDVFASADTSNMDKLTADDLVAGEPEVFARNELVIVTKPGNPEGITELADLADVGIVSLCGAEVPCGRYAGEALDKAGVVIPESSVTRGQNVAATLTAVAEGDAVAGIVYATDATLAAAQIAAVTIPDEDNVVASYPIGVIEASSSASVADAFVAFVLGEEGQAILREAGFLPPT